MGHDRQFNYTLRRVIERPEVFEQCRKLIDQYPRFKDIWMEIRRDLEGYAHENPNIVSGYYWKTTSPIYGMPSFYYMYTYDDKIVTIYSIEID